MAQGERPHIRLRLPPGLLKRIEKSREKNGSTLTGEIIDRLVHSFDKEDTAALIRQVIDATIYHLKGK